MDKFLSSLTYNFQSNVNFFLLFTFPPFISKHPNFFHSLCIAFVEKLLYLFDNFATYFADFSQYFPQNEAPFVGNEGEMRRFQ